MSRLRFSIEIESNTYSSAKDLFGEEGLSFQDMADILKDTSVHAFLGEWAFENVLEITVYDHETDAIWEASDGGYFHLVKEPEVRPEDPGSPPLFD